MAEPYVIKMPQLSDTMTEGVLVSWEKQPGDRVERGDVVATIETDKAIMDVEVFRSGFLAGPLAAVDSVVPVGEAIGYLTDTPQGSVDSPGMVTADSAKSTDSRARAAVEAEAESASVPAPAASAAPAENAYPIKMPQLSDTMTEGVLVSWEKQLGDRVERGDIVATVETDKAIMDVEVFRSGFLSGPMLSVDSVVPVGEAMAWLVDSADKVQREAKRALASATGGAAKKDIKM
jgi:dihydrolipoamide dehydrogenase